MYANLISAMRERRVRQYDLANLLQTSESTICRKLEGRMEFAPHEQARIGERLGFAPEWLFAQTRPPAAARLETPAGSNGPLDVGIMRDLENCIQNGNPIFALDRLRRRGNPHYLAGCAYVIRRLRKILGVPDRVTPVHFVVTLMQDARCPQGWFMREVCRPRRVDCDTLQTCGEPTLHPVEIGGNGEPK